MPDAMNKPDTKETKPEPKAPMKQTAPSERSELQNAEELYEDAEGSWGDLRPPSDS